MVLILTLFVTVAAGCGDFQDFQINAPTSSGENDDFTSLGLSPEFDYEVPESLPSILVDQVGYSVGSNKIAMINGETPPETFSILDEQTGREVYTGKVENKGYDTSVNAYISYADFTDFNEEGTYYIQAPSIGCSYAFQISEEPLRIFLPRCLSSTILTDAD